MVKDMHAYLVFARGGIYRDTPLDTQTTYLTSVLGLMGIVSVDTVFAEGLNMGEEVREKSLAEAMTEATNLVVDNPVEANYTVT